MRVNFQVENKKPSSSLSYRYTSNDEMVKKRSLSGNIALVFVLITFVLIVVAFSTPSWIVSDYRITGARLNRFGLWTHCFRSLADPVDVNQRRFFVGCRWIYDPFTTGYDQIRGYLVPSFLVATQFFFTLCFILVLISAILTLMYALCWTPHIKHYFTLIKLNAWILLLAGLFGGIAITVFAACGNQQGWMPGHENNFFGWSFALGCIGVISAFVASVLFFVENYVQQRKRKDFKESQMRFEMDNDEKI